MSDIRLKYQEVIDRTTKFFFTAYIALNTLFIAQLKVYPTLNQVYILFVEISIMFLILLFWYIKIESLTKMLISEIEYLKSTNEDAKKYFEFIEKKMDEKKRKKQIRVIYPNYCDDSFPILCGFLFIVSLVFRFAT